MPPASRSSTKASACATRRAAPRVTTRKRGRLHAGGGVLGRRAPGPRSRGRRRTRCGTAAPALPPWATWRATSYSVSRETVQRRFSVVTPSSARNERSVDRSDTEERARRVADESDPRGVAAELAGVVLHPAHGGRHVLLVDRVPDGVGTIGGGRRRREPVVDADEGPPLVGEQPDLVADVVGLVTPHEPAAVHVDDDRCGSAAGVPTGDVGVERQQVRVDAVDVAVGDVLPRQDRTAPARLRVRRRRGGGSAPVGDGPRRARAPTAGAEARGASRRSRRPGCLSDADRP